MAINVGKAFETDFKKCVPDYALIYRLPDAAQSFGQNDNLRFSRKNPFDFLLWDSQKHILYALEVKTVSGKSISFERAKGESKQIHYHQIEGLNQWDKYDGIICGFIIEFRELAKTIFIEIKEFNRLMSIVSKSSFNYNNLEEYGIRYTVINQEKKRTKYKYDIDSFLKQQ